MSLKRWEKKTLAAPGAAARVAEIEDELRLAAGLTALREKAGLSQRQLAQRIGLSQPRIAAIEQSRNVTLDVLERYLAGIGGELEVRVVKNGKAVTLLTARHQGRRAVARKKDSAKRATAGQPSRTTGRRDVQRKRAR